MPRGPAPAAVAFAAILAAALLAPEGFVHRAAAAPVDVAANAPTPRPPTPSSSAIGAPDWLARCAIALEDVQSGELLWRVGGTYVPMPVLQTDVLMRISGVVQHGTLTQRFENPSQVVIEALYVFPLPERAAVHHMEIRIGDRRIVSVVQERQQARATYTQAKKQGTKAALVEQERPNLFTMSVANINPGESITVVLEYVEELEVRNNIYSVKFPLTFTPRYVPDAFLRISESAGQVTVTSATVPDADRVTPPFRESEWSTAPRASFRARIDMGIALAEVRCPSHDVRVTHAGTRYDVAPETAEILADRELILEWSPAIGNVPEATLVTESDKTGSYALCMLLPPVPTAIEDAGMPTETVFVVDVSGSMGGPSIRQARHALLAAIERLRPNDRFNIIKFNERYEQFSQHFRTVDPAARSEAKNWVRGLRASGGTMIYPALLRSVELFHEEDRVDGSRDTQQRPASNADEGVVQRIIFVTDGAVANESEVLQHIMQGLGRVRLHCIGIGPSPNRYLMREMAAKGHGVCTFVNNVGDAKNHINIVFAKLARPVMSAIGVEWDGDGEAEIYPATLPDVHSGEPLVLAVRLPQGDSTGAMLLRGQTRAGPVQMRLEVNQANGSTSGAIATLWARHNVAELMDAMHRMASEPGSQDSLRSAVVRVAMAHHLVTRFTSLVAVEERVTATGDPTTVRVANALPQGSQLLRMGLPQGGTSLPLRAVIAWCTTLFGLLILMVAAPRSTEAIAANWRTRLLRTRARCADDATTSITGPRRGR